MENETVNQFGCEYCTEECEVCEAYHEGVPFVLYCECSDIPYSIEECEEDFGIVIPKPHLN